MKKLLFLTSLLFFIGCNKEANLEEYEISHLKIIAHRGGAAAKFPENSLSAIEKSVSLKVDGIEIDVRLTKDKQIVLCHDETIDRTTTGTGKIQNLTLEELRQFKLIGANNEETDQLIPTLDDVVKLIDGKTDLFVELKDNSENLSSALMAYIKENDLYERVKVLSFGKNVLLKMNNMEAKIQTGNILYSETGRIELRAADISFFKYLFVDYRTLDKRNTTELSRSSKLVYLYSLNNIYDVAKGNYLWIDGIVTDDPEYWLDLKKRK